MTESDVPAPAADPGSPSQLRPSAPPRRRWLLVAAGVLVVASGGASAFALSHHTSVRAKPPQRPKSAAADSSTSAANALTYCSIDLVDYVVEFDATDSADATTSLGTGDPALRWVENEAGPYYRAALYDGRASAQQQLLGDARGECAYLAAHSRVVIARLPRASSFTSHPRGLAAYPERGPLYGGRPTTGSAAVTSTSLATPSSLACPPPPTTSLNGTLVARRSGAFVYHVSGVISNPAAISVTISKLDLALNLASGLYDFSPPGPLSGYPPSPTIPAHGTYPWSTTVTVQGEATTVRIELLNYNWADSPCVP